MGGERVEVEGQAITGEDRQTTSGQAFGGGVDELMSERLGARAEGEGRDELGPGVGGDPPCRLPCTLSAGEARGGVQDGPLRRQGEREPFGLGRAIEFQPDLIELDVS